MLLVPMFHRVGTGRYANPPEFFDRFFASIPQAIFPGEPIAKLSYCLTFDDATEDFYKEAFPLLRKHNQKAVLAVPTSFIGTPGYCSWNELLEMERSGHVECASHTVSHAKLTSPSSEIRLSKEVLSDKLKREVISFVYPYGAFTKQVHQEAIRHYQYIFRIGSACNFSWKSPIYRIPADNASSFIRPKLSYVARCLLHKARGR